MQTIAEAVEQGTQAAQAAADRAERLGPGWIETAIDEVRAFAQRFSGPFTIERARLHCSPLPDGADARAWGAITQAAMRRGFIEKTGEYAPAASSNGSPKPLYRGRKS